MLKHTGTQRLIGCLFLKEPDTAAFAWKLTELISAMKMKASGEAQNVSAAQNSRCEAKQHAKGYPHCLTRIESQITFREDRPGSAGYMGIENLQRRAGEAPAPSKNSTGQTHERREDLPSFPPVTLGDSPPSANPTYLWRTAQLTTNFWRNLSTPFVAPAYTQRAIAGFMIQR